MDIPPCSRPDGRPANPCAAEVYRWRVYGSGPMYGDWAGWRIAGRHLIAPDGERISVERLRGILFRERAERRAKKQVRQEAAVILPFQQRESRPDDAA